MQGSAGQQFSIERDAFFARIVQQYAPLLYRVAYAVLRNPEDAEDAVADTLLKLLRGEAWRRVENERAFFSRAVWRTALDRFGSRAPCGEDPETLALESAERSPEDEVTAADERRLLHALIDRLPLELREPLLLSAVEELNSREIGELMGVPEGTVRTRLMRARATLREEFETLQGSRRRELTAGGD